MPSWFRLPGLPSGWRARWRLASLCLIGLMGMKAAAQTTAYREYQVKAVFLFNFTQFVEWPARAFPEERSPLVIGVLGEDPFSSFLDETVRGEEINHRPLLVQRYRRVEEIGPCQVLFVSRSEADRLDAILAALKDRSILTVGDFDPFARHGGMIQFVPANNHTRLRINVAAAKAAGITISSKLLRPAEIVTGGN